MGGFGALRLSLVVHGYVVIGGAKSPLMGVVSIVTLLITPPVIAVWAVGL